MWTVLPLSRDSSVTANRVLLQLRSQVPTRDWMSTDACFSLDCPGKAIPATALWALQNSNTHHTHTCNWVQLPCLLPTGTNQYAGSFLCLDMESISTLAFGKPQWTKSTMPNIYNPCKIPLPRLGRLKMNTELPKCSLALQARRPWELWGSPLSGKSGADGRVPPPGLPPCA